MAMISMCAGVTSRTGGRTSAFTSALMLCDEPVSALLSSVGIGRTDAWARLSTARGAPRKSGPG